MEADLWIKVGTLVVGVMGAGLATWKLRDETPRARRGHLREEYRFALEFLSAVSKGPVEMHPYAKEKGYQALLGGAEMTLSEAEYVLSLQNPVKAVDDYAFCKRYLVHLSTAGEKQINFAPRYRSKVYRNALLVGYLFAYWLTFMAAVAPTFLPSFHVITVLQMITTLPLTLIVFLPISYMCLRAGTRISRAERLVSRQMQRRDVPWGRNSERRTAIKKVDHL